MYVDGVAGFQQATLQPQRTSVSRLDSTVYCKKHNALCGPNELIKPLHPNREEDNQSEQIFKESF